MFSLSSLVGSARPERGLEFTPIGRRKTNHTPFSAPLEPSFDHSSDSDTLHSLSMDGASPSHRTPFPEPVRAPENSFRSKTLLGTSSSSIQDLQTENKELSGENYNLKVEVATLTKILKRTPAEFHDLANENVQLKQEMVKLSNELQNAQAQRQGQSGNQLQQEIDEKEHQIQQLKSQLKQIQGEFRTPPEVLQQLEFLKSENQKLIRRLETAATSPKPSASTGKNGALESENNELKIELHQLRKKLSDVPADAVGQIESAKQQARLFQQQVEDLQEENQEKAAKIREQSAEIAAFHATETGEVRRQRELEIELKSQISDLKSHNEQQRQELRRLVQQNEQLSQNRISGDSNGLRRLQAQLREVQEERDSENARMQAKISALRREIEEKDDEEAGLKAQIRGLVKERSQNLPASSVQHYEDQMEQMRQKEDKLSQEVRQLKQENAALHDELYHGSMAQRSESELQNREQAEKIAQLSDKLEFYEKEYDLIQDAMEGVEQAKENLKHENQKLDQQKAQLEIELESAKNRLRKLEIQQAQKFNESAILEIEEAHQKRAQVEQQRMAAQNEALNVQILELERKLAQQNADSGSETLRRSLARLETQLSEQDSLLAEKERMCERLQRSLRDKDELSQSLEARIRELSRDNQNGIKSEYEFQIRALELENDRLREMQEAERREMKENERLREIQRENEELRAMKLENDRSRHVKPEKSDFSEELHRMQYELEKLRLVQYEVEGLRKEQHENAQMQRKLQEDVQYYKTKYETMADSESTVHPVIALLESEVDEYRQSNKELHDKLDSLQERLEAANLAKFERENTRISSENDVERKAVISELHATNQKLHEQKARAEKSLEALEEDFKAVKTEKSRVETRNRNLAQELSKTSRHCTRLANRINEMDKNELRRSQAQDLDRTEARKSYSQDMEQLSRNLGSTKLQPDREDRGRIEARVSRNESNFFKAKLFDLNLKCNDLALMNTFMANAMKSSDVSMRDDLVKMAQCGIYPELSEPKKPKLTLKLLATFVLSMVKMRRRAEKSRARAQKLALLRSDIDRDRITLIAESR